MHSQDAMGQTCARTSRGTSCMRDHHRWAEHTARGTDKKSPRVPQSTNLSGGAAAARSVASAAVLLVDGRPEQLVRQDGARRHRHQVAVVAAVDGLDEGGQLLLVVGALAAKAA